MLPDHVNLILLSATVPNTKEFASWVGRTKKKDIYVISTPKRPVPLDFYLWANKKTFKIVNENGKFLTQGSSPPPALQTLMSDGKTHHNPSSRQRILHPNKHPRAVDEEEVDRIVLRQQISSKDDRICEQ